MIDDDPDYEWDDDNEEYDDGDEDWFDCHMTADGLCGMAGSEECEFECPYRQDQIRQERLKKK